MNECGCPNCLVPLAEITGPMSSEQAEQWARSQNIELRSTWNGRTAISADDAATIYQRAEKDAEIVRARKAAKMAEQAARLAPVPTGTPVPEGLGDLTALEVMTLDKVTKRLDKVDKLREELREPGVITYHPVTRDEG